MLGGGALGFGPPRRDAPLGEHQRGPGDLQRAGRALPGAGRTRPPRGGERLRSALERDSHGACIAVPSQLAQALGEPLDLRPRHGGSRRRGAEQPAQTGRLARRGLVLRGCELRQAQKRCGESEE